VNAVNQLEREWPILEQQSVARALRDWQHCQPPLLPFQTARQLLRFLHAAPAEQTDPLFLALLTLAREDVLAGRFLLQAILPALRAQAERIRHQNGQRDELWELLLFYAWEAICCYPLCRRLRVAANLVLQVLHATTRELHRPHSKREEPFAHALLDDVLTRAGFAHVDGCALCGPDLPVLEALAARLISERDAELILQSRVDGVRLPELAHAFAVSYHALRQRRQRAEQQLRGLLDARGDVSKAPRLDLTSDAGPFSLSRPARETWRAA
jgi:hypothetical protein